MLCATSSIKIKRGAQKCSRAFHFGGESFSGWNWILGRNKSYNPVCLASASNPPEMIFRKYPRWTNSNLKGLEPHGVFGHPLSPLHHHGTEIEHTWEGSKIISHVWNILNILSMSFICRHHQHLHFNLIKDGGVRFNLIKSQRLTL